MMRSAMHRSSGAGRRWMLSCILVLLMLLMPAAHADKDEVVRVGYMLHKGYQEGGPGEIKTGYGYEYLQMLRNYTGWTYEYVYVDSWEEQVALLASGEIDMMLHAFRTEERMETMLFSVQPMGRESNYVYTRSNHPLLNSGDVLSLDGMTVGYMAGDGRYATFMQWCGKNDVTADMVSYTDLAAMHDDLASGAIDAIVGSNFTSSPYPGDWVTILFMEEQPIYIAVRRGREDLMEQINAAHAQILTLNPDYPDDVRRKYRADISTYVPALTYAQQRVLEERGTLVFGYCDQHRPISYTDRETGALQGVLADYLQAMTQTYGMTFEIVAFDSDIELLEALLEGRVDIIAPVSYAFGMAENSGVSITNAIDKEAMLALFKPYAGMEKKDIFRRIVVLKDAITERDYVRRFYPNAEMVSVETVEAGIQLVETGRADCYIVNSSAWSWYVREYPGIQRLQIINLPNSLEINMAVRTEDVALVPILNLGINLLNESYVDHAIIAYSDASEEVTLWKLLRDNPFAAFSVAVAIVLFIVLLLVISRLTVEKRHVHQIRMANQQIEQARQDAERARQEAVRANEAKSTFLTSMSHDIRTPMNAIVGMTTLAAKHLGNPDYVRNCLSKVMLASDHLLTLINDVLDINKIESGNLSLTPSVFSLADSIMNLANIGRHQLQDKGHRFEIRVHNIQQEYLFADELRINQVFINLLSNAVKYTPVGGSIIIDVMEEPVTGEADRVRLVYVIEDTGIGMSEEFQTHMYDLFAMANRNSRMVSGSGVGLSICKRLVELMEGSIVCQSQEGKGTRFTVTLELPVADRVVDHLMLPPMKILLVDDDEVFLATASDTLRDLGLSPDCAGSGEEAVRMVKEKHDVRKDYPLIIIDYQMPEMDGLETTRQIRMQVGPDVSIIVISAYASEEIRDAAMAAGANGFINKPFFRSNAYQSISEIMGMNCDESELLSDIHHRVRGMNLLIAEDNELNWEIIRELLGMYDVTTTRAENGQECLELLAQAAPGEYDCVLMDIQMPVMNGYDAARSIRSMERTDLRTLPIIAMTADAYTEDVLRCTQAGMNGHIPKPIDMDRLLEALGDIRK